MRGIFSGLLSHQLFSDRSFQKLGIWLCSLMLLSTQGFPVAEAGVFLKKGPDKAAQKNVKAVIEKDFLPPVASINPKLSPAGNISNARQASPDNALGPVSLMAATSPVILKTRPPLQRLDNNLNIPATSSDLQKVISLQHNLDDADLKALWDATVEKNPVIRFSLEKLVTPPDIHPQKSSMFLRKTLSLLISGAAMGSTFFLPAGNSYQNMGVMASGDALRNIVNGNNQLPKGGALSPTEQIQLAGLVDDLRSNLVQSYHDYKSTLQSLMTEHAVALHNNALYSKALSSNDDLATMAAATAYYKSQLQENRLRQQAKLYRLKLERLAGADIVNNLALSLPAGQQLSAQAASHNPGGK